MNPVQATATRTRRDPEATRQLLLEAAAREIHRQGFQAASLDQILAETGVTKGALYHHFANKRELGYAVLDEVIKPMILDGWLAPLAGAQDPIEAIREVLRAQREERSEMACSVGCPLNNLAQEMSPLDEGFRRRIHQAFETWRGGVAQALARGQKNGTVRTDLDPEKIATFFLATLEGTIGLAKNAQDESVFDASFHGIDHFLETLRPASA